MSLHRLRQATWLRTVMQVLVLCFALGTLAHAGHTHEQGKLGATHFDCDFCTSFAGVIDTPVPMAPAITWPVASYQLVAPPSRFVQTRPVSAAQARAPPVSC